MIGICASAGVLGVTLGGAGHLAFTVNEGLLVCRFTGFAGQVFLRKLRKTVEF